MNQECIIEIKDINRYSEVNTAVLKSDQDFIKNFENQIQQTITRHNLLNTTDKILVAVSGGKDSTVLLHVLKALNYPVEAITVDAKIGCYTEKNLINIRKLTASLNIKLHEISFTEEFGSSLCYLISVLESEGHNLKSCTVCGVLRRRLLNKKARELSATKIVTGHNLDDESQVIMMNFLKGNLDLATRMGPKSGQLNSKKFVQRIKPMYFTREEDIIRYSKINKFPVNYGKCPCSVTSYRYSVRESFETLIVNNPKVKENIINNFSKVNQNLRANIIKSEINLCNACDEPSRDIICQGCKILDKVAGNV